MTHAYIRVSTDQQTVENQRFEIINFCRRQGLTIDGWIEETVSGTRPCHKRRLGTLLENVAHGDLIICSELSRLGRSLFMIMEILSHCMRRGCRLWTIKDGYRLGEDIQSKVLAFAFGLSAEIERNLISQRTREALARLRAEGRQLGRPPGRRSAPQFYKLHDDHQQVVSLLADGVSQRQIARELGVDRSTVGRYIQRFIKTTPAEG